MRDLIAKLPAETLEDAAVQLGVAFSKAGSLHHSDWRDAARYRRLCELHGAVHRIMLSVLPIVATAAGLDLAALGYEEVPRLRLREFGEEAAQ